MRPTLDIYTGPDTLDRTHHQNYCEFGGGLGTDIYTKQRGEDGSNAPSFDLHGGNGKYPNAVLTVLQPWDLVNVVEPNSRIRNLRGKLSSRALKQKVSEYPCPECDATFGNRYDLLGHQEQYFQKVFGFDAAYAAVISSFNGFPIRKTPCSCGHEEHDKRGKCLVNKTCRCARISKRVPRIDDETLSNESRTVVAAAKKLLNAKTHLLADEYSREEMDINDPLVLGRSSHENKRIEKTLTLASNETMKK